MPNPFVTEFEARNFGCLRDVKVNLTRLHAFIGPNDSGKTTILQGIRTLMNVLTLAVTGQTDGQLQDARFGRGLSLSLRSDEGVTVAVQGLPAGRFSRTLTGPTFAPPIHDDNPGIFANFSRTLPAFALSGVREVRLDPDEMAQPGQIIPDGNRLGLSSARGRGLAAVYDAILSRGNDDFRNIVAEVKKLFPAVKNLGLAIPEPSRKVFRLELEDGTFVPTENLSEGLLYYLGFAVIPYLAPTSVLLVEEPENGLHPARISEIVKLLRKVSEETQVLIATHSPLVINELQPEEVTLVTRDPKLGTQTRRISDTKDFAKRSKVYALGELWLSYADGGTEANLVDQKPEE